MLILNLTLRSGQRCLVIGRPVHGHGGQRCASSGRVSSLVQLERWRGTTTSERALLERRHLRWGRSGQISSTQDRLPVGSCTDARTLVGRLSARSTLSWERPSTDGRSVSGRMNILRRRGRRQRLSISLSVPEQCKSGFDGSIVGIEVGSSGVGIDGVVDLIVARLVQASEIEPDFADVGVEPDSTRVGIQGVSVLVDLVVEHSDRAPKGGVPSIPVNRLLISLVCLVELLTSHESSAEQVPALRVRRI